jgi:hypothetical protein
MRKIRSKSSTGHSTICLLSSRYLCLGPVRKQDKPAALLARTVHGRRLAHSLARARRFTLFLSLQHS